MPPLPFITRFSSGSSPPPYKSFQDPAWAKPYLRQALALSGMERYDEAVQVLATGLALSSKGGGGGGEGEAADAAAHQELRIELQRELEEAHEAVSAAAACRAAKRRKVEAVRRQEDPAVQALAILQAAGVLRGGEGKGGGKRVARAIRTPPHLFAYTL